MDSQLAEDEIAIAVKAIGMTSRDLLIAMGQGDTTEFGSECSGTVTKVGSKVTNLAIGDRVAGISMSHNTYSIYTRAMAAFAFKIHDKMKSLLFSKVNLIFCVACTIWALMYPLKFK